MTYHSAPADWGVVMKIMNTARTQERMPYA